MHWLKCLLQHDFNFILFGYDSHFIIWSNSLLLFLLAFFEMIFPLLHNSMALSSDLWRYEVTMIIHLFETLEIFWSLVSEWKCISSKIQKRIKIEMKLGFQHFFLLPCLPGKGLEKGNYFNVILCCFYTKVYFSKLHLWT